MIDNFSLALTHGLMLLAAWRLLRRPDLDREDAREGAARAAADGVGAMRDLVFVAYLGLFFLAGFRRPFLFVLAYVYIDLVSPQRLTYYLLNAVPISMIASGLAILGWLAADKKDDVRVVPRQGLLFLLLGYCWYTTLHADFPVEAAFKWEWVWKSLAFAIFLPLTLRTKLRIEALLLFVVLATASIIIVGGIKTLATGGGGYGQLNLMVANNSGLYEGSTISMAAIALIPVILWLMKHGTIFPPDWRLTLFGSALIFACLLIPVGTEARTGLLCIGLLAVLLLRDAKRRFIYIGAAALLAVIAVPFLPASFTDRMSTIKSYQADASASTRIAVWQWTWAYVKDHPMGGGFDAYLQNNIRYDKVKVEKGTDGNATVARELEVDKARAYHSAYFEMLGEQGWPGLILWLGIHLGGLFRMEVLRRRYRKADGDEAWIAPLASALQHGHLVYMLGSAFVGIALNPFIYLIVGAQIGLDTYLARARAKVLAKPFRAAPRALAA